MRREGYILLIDGRWAVHAALLGVGRYEPQWVFVADSPQEARRFLDRWLDEGYRPPSAKGGNG